MGVIQLKTDIPGPKSRALADRRDAAVPRGLSHATPLYVARAQEAWIEDVDGNRFEIPDVSALDERSHRLIGTVL